MEQRALLAVALVAGCVTAAGAGGYVAVRQLTAAAPASTEQAPPTETSAGTPASGTQAPDGTETEVLPTPAVPAATPAPAPAPVPRDSSPAPARVRPGRESNTPARSAPSAPASPPAADARRNEPPSQAAPSYRPAPAPPRASEPAPTSSTARHDTTRDPWPSRDSSAEPSRDDKWPSRDPDTTGAALPSRTVATEPATPPAPVKRFEAVTIPADSVIGVQLETTISSESARVEDPVRARVTRDVVSGGDVVVPAGARLIGNVVLVEEGGRVRERSRLGVRFHTLVLADGTEVRLPTETVYRDGESPAGRSAARIGGATVGGAIIGAILGGGKGAAIGAATGAGGGTAVAMAGGRRPAELRAGQPITVRVSDAVTTQVER